MALAPGRSAPHATRRPAHFARGDAVSPNPEDTQPFKGKLAEPEPTDNGLQLPPARPAGSEAFLVRIHPPGPALGLRYPLGPNPVVIGRVGTCAVHDPDLSVSLTHARIEQLPDGRFRVTDLGSRNGTFVNHVRVDSTVLGDGDYLRVGSAIYRFLAGGNVEAGYHEELHRLAVSDPLTGLPNRRALTEFLERRGRAGAAPPPRTVRRAVRRRSVQGDQRHARPPRRRRDPPDARRPGRTAGPRGRAPGPVRGRRVRAGPSGDDRRAGARVRRAVAPGGRCARVPLRGERVHGHHQRRRRVGRAGPGGRRRPARPGGRETLRGEAGRPEPRPRVTGAVVAVGPHVSRAERPSSGSQKKKCLLVLLWCGRPACIAFTAREAGRSSGVKAMQARRPHHKKDKQSHRAEAEVAAARVRVGAVAEQVLRQHPAELH